MAFDASTPHRPPGQPLRVALFSGNYNYTVDGANKALNRLVQHLEQVEGARVRVYSPTAAVAASRRRASWSPPRRSRFLCGRTIGWPRD